MESGASFAPCSAVFTIPYRIADNFLDIRHLRRLAQTASYRALPLSRGPPSAWRRGASKRGNTEPSMLESLEGPAIGNSPLRNSANTPL